jgi:hypothetical protein
MNAKEAQQAKKKLIKIYLQLLLAELKAAGKKN